MSERLSPQVPRLKVEAHEALVAVPMTENGQDITVYFVDEEAADTALPEQVQEALNLAGAWSDLDWQETEQALERIRHESTPTPLDEL
jgi:hypothetical protein